MKVLGVVGGPRVEGNTARLVEEVLAGAKAGGHEVKLVKLGELEFSHMGWDGEKYTFPDDAFTELQPYIESMGGLVAGFPIYFGQPDSRFYKFLERLYYWSKTHGEEYLARWPKGVKVVSCITYGAPDPAQYDRVLDWWEGICKGRGMVVHGRLVAEASRAKPVSGNAPLLARARALGGSL